jgi:ketosteroid isomerase-like protein
MFEPIQAEEAMMSKTETIIGDIYDAWRAQDLDWLGSYLPDDFCHVIYIPKEVHPFGGIARGKTSSLARLGMIADDFDILVFDTSGLIVHKDQAAVEIPVRYRHRETGALLETVVANFWTFEAGWPIRLTEYHDIERVRAFTNRVAALAAV